MIIFDYGHTLLYEHSIDFLRGHEALFEHIKININNLTPTQVNDFSNDLYYRILDSIRDTGFELHQWQTQRFLYEYLGIEFNLSHQEIEDVLWNNAAPGAVLPNAEIMLNHINAKGIRSGVISNISWSGTALTERINRLLPHNQFEFIITSSEYLFRKPSPYLFELALRKAGLEASEVWFCGDNVKADIEGAAAAGIFPVWYEDTTVVDPWDGRVEGAKPSCQHLHIHDWLELIKILEEK